MNKKKKIIIGVFIGIIVCWVIVFGIDYSRVSNLKEPIFVIIKKENDSTQKSITYQGFGYRIEETKD